MTKTGRGMPSNSQLGAMGSELVENRKVVVGKPRNRREERLKARQMGVRPAALAPTTYTIDDLPPMLDAGEVEAALLAELRGEAEQ